jgi:hypothetical protein
VKKSLLTLGAIYVLAYYVACAPAHFSRDSQCGAGCVFLNGFKEYRYEVIPKEGKVDILVISDNSASMSFEQNNMGARIESLIGVLDSQNVDYRIAVTTTDIATSNNPPRPINQNGALQNGRLIPMGGKPFISRQNTPLAVDRINLFRHAVQRSETQSCESWLVTKTNPSDAEYKQNCPSGDERGIYAARLAIERNEGSWIRADAHLAVIVLADEDVRSGLYSASSSFALSDYDRYENLISAVGQLYPGKHFRLHAIIVRPTDPGCKAIQDGQMGGKVSSSYGLVYYNAAMATGGVVGDICANDYGSQLTTIADNIGESVLEKTLFCANPQPIDSMTPLVSFVPVASSHSYSIVGNKIQFSPHLAVGTKAYLQYKCPAD